MAIPSIGRPEPVYNRSARPSDGQIVKGKVLDLLEGEQAVVDVHGHALKARVEVPLKTGGQYLFQVLKEPEGYRLKMIKELADGRADDGDSLGEMIRLLGLPNDSKARALIQLFQKRDWPLQADLLHAAHRLFESGRFSEYVKALDIILSKGWPLEKSLLKALGAAQAKSVSDRLNTLLEAAKSTADAAPALTRLAALLDEWPGPGRPQEMAGFVHALRLKARSDAGLKEIKAWLIERFPEHAEQIEKGWPDDAARRLTALRNGEDLNAFLKRLGLPVNASALQQMAAESRIFQMGKFSGGWLKDTLFLMGYFHEAGLFSALKHGEEPNAAASSDNLKAVLLSLLASDRSDESMRAAVNQALQQITGQQLQSIQADKAFVQLFFTFPVRFGSALRDVEAILEGKRNKRGEMDGDYWRLAFRFELANIKETILNILVQKRMVTLTLYNGTPGIDRLVHAFRPSLSEGLAKWNYRLASLKIVKDEDALDEMRSVFTPKPGALDVRV